MRASTPWAMALLVVAAMTAAAQVRPVAPIVVLDPSGDRETELAMTVQEMLRSAGFEIRATRNLDKLAGTGESGLPGWQEPPAVYLRTVGAPEEIGGDAGRYAQWVGAAALVRLRTSEAAAPVIVYSPEGEWAAASEALAERIQRQLPGSRLAACTECVLGKDAVEVVVDLGAGAMAPAANMAAGRALAAGIEGLGAASPRSAAQGAMTSPSPDSTLSGASVTFQWAPGMEATNYWLMVGTWLGGDTVYSRDQGTGLSAAVSGLPVDGRLVYVRLWSYIGGAWQSADYTYRAFSSGGTVPAKAEMTSPLSGSTLTGASALFQWSAGVAVSRYYLMVGLWPGGNTLYDSDQGVNRQPTVAGLPVDGRRIYLRLWSYIEGSWQYQDSSYVAAGRFTPAKATMTSPVAGSALPGPAVTFQWSAGNGVLRYYLFVGSWPGGNSYYRQDMLTSQSANVTNLPADGSLVYVRLWSYIDGSWESDDTTYTASGTAPTPVRAVITSPADGSTLPGATVTFQWTGGTAVQRYYLFVGTQAGNNDVSASDQGLNLSATLMGLPVNGELLYVRLWTYINGEWQYCDYTYRAAG